MDLANERWGLLWAVQRSARYHARRQGFFDRWRLAISGANVIFGSTAAANVVSQGGMAITLVAALLVTAMSAIDLVVGTSTMARLHHDLRRRFLAMETEIRCKPDCIKEDIDRWTAERLRIEADEPPVYVILDLLCENELARAHGMAARVRLEWWRIWLAHWLRQESYEATPAR